MELTPDNALGYLLKITLGYSKEQMDSQLAYAKHAPIVKGPEGKKGAGGERRESPGPKRERETQDHPKKTIRPGSS